MARQLSNSFGVRSRLEYNHRSNPQTRRNDASSPRRFGYNVNKVRFTRHVGNGLYGGRAYGATRGLSSMSREVFEDVLRFEEEIETMSIKITGIGGRSTQEMNQKINGTRPLPSYDRGPTNTHKDAHNNPASNSSTKANFKYYASEKQREEKEKYETDKLEQFAQEKKMVVASQLELNKEKGFKTDAAVATAGHTIIASDLEKDTLGNGPNQTNSKTTSDPSVTSRTGISDTSRKGHEVTIVGKKIFNNSVDEDNEPFTHEYKYSHNITSNEAQLKTFEEMDDDEKLKYFRSQLHLSPDEIRELTFRPKVNEPKVIHHTYTGVDTVSWSMPGIKPSRRPQYHRKNIFRRVHLVLPYERKSYMLSKLQGVVYRHINEVYGSSARDTREKHFFEKLAEVQMESIQRKYEMLAEEERRHLEDKYRQQEQLKRLRKKFEDDAWRRFMTQYVTSKVAKAEYQNREEYGLPNHLSDERPSHYATSRKKYAVSPQRRAKANHRRYSNLFSFRTGPVYNTSRGKPLRFEEFDTIDIDTEDKTGHRARKKQDVDVLMREAKRITDQSEDDTELEESPRPVQKSFEVPVDWKKSFPDRPHHSKVTDGNERKHSIFVARSRKTRSRSVQHQQMPKSIKELIERRQSLAVPTNRYKVSEFAAIKSDLLTENEKMNKNKILKNKISQFPNISKLLNSDKDSKSTSESKSIAKDAQIDSPLQHVSRDMRTPPDTPTPVWNSANQANPVNVEETENKSDEIKESKLLEGNVFLDHIETKMAIDTARDQNKNDQNQKGKFSALSETKSPKKVCSKPTDQKHLSWAPAQMSKTNLSRDLKQSSRRNSLESITVTSDNKGNESNVKSNPVELTEHVKVGGHRRYSIPFVQNKTSNVLENKTVNVVGTTFITEMDDSPEDMHSSTEERVHKMGGKNISDHVIPSQTYDPRKVNEQLPINTNTIHKQSDTPKSNDNINKSVKVSETVTEYIHTISDKKNGDTKVSSTISNKSSKHDNSELHAANKTLFHTRVNAINGSAESQKESFDNKVVQQRPKNVSHRKSRSRTPTRGDVNITMADDIRIKREEHEKPDQNNNRPNSRSTSRERTEKARKRSTSHGRKGSIHHERKKSISNENDGSLTRATYLRFPDIKKNEMSKTSVQLPASTKTTVSRQEHVEEKEFTTEYTSNNNNDANQWKNLMQKYIHQPSPKIGKTEDRLVLEVKANDDDDDDIDIFERAKRRYALEVDDDDDESDD